ncbi:MAG: glycosyltransferase [Streptosporangiales bacterium]|nr:glycosyltransferase [Streptosporangiales bacterium]
MARVQRRGGGQVSATAERAQQGARESVDDAAIATLIGEYGDSDGVLRLPPVALVIAAYNEEAGLGPVLDALPATACGLDVAKIVVVDGASDETAKIARKHGAIVADVPVNRGQGAALRLGYRIAREGGAAYVVTTDADGQYDPAEVEVVLRPIVDDEADFVTGSRRLGRQETDDMVRHIGVRVFATLVSTLTGQRITDTSFGLRAMRAEVTGNVRLSQPQYQSSELLIGVLARGYRVREVPGAMLKRNAGSSKKGNNLLYGYRYARVVLGTWSRERRGRPEVSRSANRT